MKISFILLAATATALNLPRADDRQPGRGGPSSAPKGSATGPYGGPGAPNGASSTSSALSTASSAPATADGSCPAVWTQVSSELSALFSGCNDMARAAIRAVFHDCFPQPGCDGSLAVPEELSRPINAPLVPLVMALKAMAAQNKVGIADLLMFAGCKSQSSILLYIF
jgi:hypothetical protein